MLYLHKKQFAPIILLASILFCILSILLLIGAVISARIELLFVFFLFAIMFFVIVLVMKKETSKNIYFLEVKGDMWKIKFPNVNLDKINSNDSNFLLLNKKSVEKIDYYKMTSIISWLSIFIDNLPRSVYVTYKTPTKKIKTKIGYLTFVEIKQFSMDNNIRLVVH